jgi:hypothetical protein
MYAAHSRLLTSCKESSAAARLPHCGTVNDSQQHDEVRRCNAQDYPMITREYP